MVNNTINATYTETYDLQTTVGKMAVIGVHTPTASSLKKMYKGFFENYKKFKINGCSIFGVCASNQALTPNEVGLEAGKTSPRDVWNPILFTACTGESLNLLLDQIYAVSGGTDNGSVHKIDTSMTDAFNAYYTMLADDRLRKYHPQGGIKVGNLRPMVHKVVTTQPFKWNVAAATLGNSPRFGGSSGNTVDGSNTVRGFGGPNGTADGSPSCFVSNGIEPMGWLETTYTATDTDNSDPSNPTTKVMNVLASNVPKVYMGAIVLPPAELIPLYFRFSVTWSISFRDFRPAYEIGSISDSVVESNVGMGPANLYFDMINSSKLLQDEHGSFDCDNVDAVDIVFEKAK